MKILFLGLFVCSQLLVFLTKTPAASSVTIIGAITTDFQQYGLQGKSFGWKDVAQMNAETERRLCECMDDSLLVLFAAATPGDVLEGVFSSPPVTKSLEKVLRRGGVLYFDPLYWDTLAALPSSMQEFFGEAGAYLINLKNYEGQPKGNYIAVANLAFQHPFNALKDTVADRGAGAYAFVGMLPTSCKVLLVDRDKKLPLMILQESVYGKGQIVNSYVYSITRAAQDAFMANMLRSLYGEREKVGVHALLAGKAKNATADVDSQSASFTGKVIYPSPTKKVPVMDGTKDGTWKNSTTVALMDHKTGTSPQRATEVSVMYDNANLYMFFECNEPNLAGIRTAAVIRDGEVWSDDCVELFLSNEKTATYHFIVSASGVQFDENNGNASWNPSYQVATGKIKGGWTVELAIPFSVVGLNPRDLPIWRINFCREEQQLKELSSWSPTPQGFADPTSFGYLSFLPEKEFLAAFEKKGDKCKTEYKDGYLVWYDSPYRTHCADTLPEHLTATHSLKVMMARNEKECTNVLITNFTDAGLTFRAEPDPAGIIDDKKQHYDFDRLFTLKEAVPRLNRYKQRQMDPLVRMNEGNILVVPPNETRQLWIDVKGALPAGNYSGTFSLVPVDSLWKEFKVSLTVNILPLDFHGEMPCMGYGFGPYPFSWNRDALHEAYLAFCPEYQLNYVYLLFPVGALKKDASGKVVVSRNKEDYFKRYPISKDGKTEYVFDEHLAKKHAKGWFYCYGIYDEFNTKLKELGQPSLQGPNYVESQLSDAEWERIFREWVANWFAFLKAEKIDFKDFYVPLLDEPNEKIIERLLRVARIMREIAPEVQFTCTNCFLGLDGLKKLDPMVDLWMPYVARITGGRPDAEEELAFYQHKKTRFVTYQNTNMAVHPLLSYYRLGGIRNWLWKSGGRAICAANSWRENDWREFDHEEPDGAFIYHGDKGPIPSIRLEAFRESLEDYRLLFMAQQKLARESNARLAELTSKIFLEKLMQEEDADQLLKWREEVLVELVADGK